MMNDRVLPQPPELAPLPQSPLMALVKVPNGGLVTLEAMLNGAVTDAALIVPPAAKLNVSGANTLALPLLSSQLGATFSLTRAEPPAKGVTVIVP